MARIFEERMIAVQEHLLTLSAVVTEIAEGHDGRKAAVTASPASPLRATLPFLGRLKKSALTTPKDVINALGFPVETTPADVSECGIWKSQATELDLEKIYESSSSHRGHTRA